METIFRAADGSNPRSPRRAALSCGKALGLPSGCFVPGEPEARLLRHAGGEAGDLRADSAART